MVFENRKHLRVILPTAITLKIDDKVIQGSECQNISLGGMYVKTSEKINENEKGSLTLTVHCGNKTENFKTNFYVVWTDTVNKYGVGICFTNIDSDNLQSLENIIYHQMFI